MKQSRQRQLIESVDQLLKGYASPGDPKSIMDYIERSGTCSANEVAGLKLLYGVASTESTWSRIATLQSQLREIAEECRDRPELEQGFHFAGATLGSLADAVRGKDER